MRNPWLDIPAGDYEGHMAAVGQLRFLSDGFAETLDQFQPRRIAVLGCATGNGFEHLIGRDLEQVIGIDLHPDYLATARARFAARIPALELRCADLAANDCVLHDLDLVHAALFFEYVDPAQVLPRIASWLAAGGVLTTVLQLPAPAGGPVSATPFASLQRLEPLMRLVAPERLIAEARASGLTLQGERCERLASGKPFHRAVLRR